MAINKTGATVGGGVLAIVIAIGSIIMPKEGLVTTAAPDPIGIPTLCFGETKGVKLGDKKTKQECIDMLYERIPDYLGPVDKIMPGLPDNRRIAYTDFAYNVGVGALQKSRIPSFEKAGEWEKGCAELNRYVYAGGKKLNGLVTRRAEEYTICMNSQ